MSYIKIDRWKNHDCTIGRLTALNFKCFTLELPWKGNAPDISCIPNGQYEYYKRTSPSNGEVLELRNVLDRTYIQIHAGNYTRQIHGCILVGDSIKHLDADEIPDVTNSKKTLKKLLEAVADRGIIEIY